MPAVILGTEVERGPARWRAQTSGFDAEGPADRTLVISSTATEQRFQASMVAH